VPIFPSRSVGLIIGDDAQSSLALNVPAHFLPAVPVPLVELRQRNIKHFGELDILGFGPARRELVEVLLQDINLIVVELPASLLPELSSFELFSVRILEDCVYDFVQIASASR
jgi:hypothetical protein